MPKSYIDYPIQFEIDDEVIDRFGRRGIICGYYIGRAGFRYEIEQPDKNWYEHPKYVKEARSIGFNNDEIGKN